jgi:hypothetical protein
MFLVPSFVEMLQPFACCFCAPSFANWIVVLTGWVFARRRTITGALVAAKLPDLKHHSAYHRLFASARWSLDAVGLVLFECLLPWCKGTIFLVIDDTLAHKHGLKLYGGGMHYDRSISSKKMVLKSWGHNWVFLAVTLPLPFQKERWVCLPVLFRLYLSQKTVEKKGGVYRTRPELATELLDLLCKGHPDLRFHLLVDSAYGGKQVLRNLPANCDLTARWITNARLYTSAATCQCKGHRGRKRVHGDPLPSPMQMLQDRCRRCTLRLYGSSHSLRLADVAACFYAVPHRLLRVVAVEPVSRNGQKQVFFSTATDASAEEILMWYARRWTGEVMIHDAKGQLGFEQPQGWTQKAALRTAPMIMLLYSLVVLWFIREGHTHYQPLQRPWLRHKTGPSFADMLATLRSQSVLETFSSTPPTNHDHNQLLETLLHTLKQAA